MIYPQTIDLPIAYFIIAKYCSVGVPSRGDSFGNGKGVLLLFKIKFGLKKNLLPQGGDSKGTFLRLILLNHLLSLFYLLFRF